jgi:hypothetical protein
VIYKGEDLGSQHRIDLLVEQELILELKSVEKLLPIHHAQLLTELRLTRMSVGLLINFNVPRLTRIPIGLSSTSMAPHCALASSGSSTAASTFKALGRRNPAPRIPVSLKA